MNYITPEEVLTHLPNEIRQGESKEELVTYVIRGYQQLDIPQDKDYQQHGTHLLGMWANGSVFLVLLHVDKNPAPGKAVFFTQLIVDKAQVVASKEFRLVDAHQECWWRGLDLGRVVDLAQAAAVGARHLVAGDALHDVVHFAGLDALLPFFVDFPDLFHDAARPLLGLGADHEPRRVRQERHVLTKLFPMLQVLQSLGAR